MHVHVYIFIWILEPKLFFDLTTDAPFCLKFFLVVALPQDCFHICETPSETVWWWRHVLWCQVTVRVLCKCFTSSHSIATGADPSLGVIRRRRRLAAPSSAIPLLSLLFLSKCLWQLDMSAHDLLYGEKSYLLDDFDITWNIEDYIQCFSFV